MLKLLKFILGLFIIVYRCGLIYTVSVGLYTTYNDQNNSLNNLQWYICAIIFDMYLINLEKDLSSDIYIKKDDGKKIDSGDNEN